MESTIFTGTFYTAACACAPSRRTVGAREHMSTVLDHLVTHIVDVPFFLASSTEERAHGCSLPSATAAYPRTRHVKHKPRRRPTSHSSEAHGAPASFSLAEGIICARQLKPGARRSTVSGDWEPTRTGSTVTRGVEAALDRLRTGVSHNNGWLPRPLQPAIPGTCRWCGADAAQQARKELRTETPPPHADLTPPRSDARQTARCAASTAVAALVS
ncbi:hypothetical protein TcCL_ESM05964 [Trypanosoma cruzi]|nr:hypothetical protein TcCL_ESM05964 [Trypanosoma cruzi]